MTHTDQGRAPAVQPQDPAMQPVDPGLFAPLTIDENAILGAHLVSGWYKQGAVYPVLAEPWKETAALLDDLHAAHDAASAARRGPLDAAKAEAHPAERSPSPELPEPEAGA